MASFSGEYSALSSLIGKARLWCFVCQGQDQRVDMSHPSPWSYPAGTLHDGYLVVRYSVRHLGFIGLVGH